MVAEAGMLTRARAGIARRRRAFRLARAAVLGTILPTALLAAVTAFRPPDSLWIGLLCLWAVGWLLVPPLLIGSLLASWDYKLPGLRVRWDEKTLYLGEPERRIERDTIVGGMCVYEDGGTKVELSIANGSVVRIACASDGEARQLLRGLGITDAGRTVAHELGATWPALRAGAALLAGGAFTLMFGGVLTLFYAASYLIGAAAIVQLSGLTFVLTTLYAAARRAPSRIVIGSDGVSLEGTRHRFIPYCNIAAILPKPEGVFLVTSGKGLGKRIVLTTERGPRSDALVNELRVAIDRAADRADWDAPAQLAELDRGQRTVTEWRETLRRLAVGDGDYRRASIDRDLLVETASDAAASTARRVAAALALSHTRDERAIERVRIAVDSLADHGTRSVLCEALKGTVEDEALEEALAAAEKRFDRA